MNEEMRVPLLIENELSREKQSINDLSLLKFNLKGKNYYDLIVPYLQNKALVFGYIDRFFNTELVVSFPIMDKAKVYSDLLALYEDDMIKLHPTREELIFIGQILLLMRISYLSYFNCGYETEEPPLLVDARAHNLAVLCFDESRFPTNITTIETTRLVLLIQYCHQYSPELIRWDLEAPFDKVTDIIKMATFLDFNIESDDQYIRRAWHQIMEIDRTDFIYSGKPKAIHYNSYTTDFSKRPTIQLRIEDVIDESLYQRNKFETLYETLSAKIKNVRTLSKLEDYEGHLKTIIECIKDISLDQLLKMKSSTRAERALKSIYFNNFLDLNCLAYMLSNRIFLYYDDERTSSLKGLASIEALTKIASSIIPLAYFFDPGQQHAYNLQAQFGHNIHFISKIVQCLHRATQFHFTLYSKLNFISVGGLKLDILKGRVAQNVKVIVSSYSRVAEKYLYAKRLHLLHSYIMLSVFEDPTKQYFSKVTDPTLYHEMTNEEIDLFEKHLIELSGDRKLSSEVYNEPLVGYFENLLSNSEQIEVDSSTIEQIERFLKG